MNQLQQHSSKRPSLLSFPIPFDHPWTVPMLVTTVSASALLYHYLQWTHTAELIEAVRQREIKKRRALERPEDRFASLKVERCFVNPFDEWKDASLIETTWFWLRRWRGNGLPKTEGELAVALPVKVPDFETIFKQRIKEERPARNVTFTWFGQSTCLISMDGLAILTDPAFSKRTVNDYVGPKRLRPVPCKLKDIHAKLDIVLISHDHFDHLDESVVYELGNSVTWYIPLGLRDWFLKRGVENFVEMDWWQEIRHSTRPDIMIACVPAMHWSGSRTPFEKNGTLWCSYVVKSRHDTVFFCGDTGYSPELYQAIGKMYAPFTLAAIPIGSFKPASLMKCVHISPDEAIQVHDDLQAPTVSVGIHWGTFLMSEEHYLEAPRTLARLWAQRDLHAPLSVSDTKEQQIDDTQQPLTPCASSSTSSASSMDKHTPPRDSKFITTAFGETIVL
ncbi:beta-lactamase superfamily domain-containing protein [Gongronella butleri]|nr:beta-lactamase superfamily domain-containing protein [Gongronella butleri]